MLSAATYRDVVVARLKIGEPGTRQREAKVTVVADSDDGVRRGAHVRGGMAQLLQGAGHFP